MSDPTTARKGVGGRPRLLTRDQVVAAALRLGLEGLTMKRVAAELGVTIATLYQYVASRDELLRLSVGQVIGGIALPPDDERHWSDYIRDFADAVSQVMGSDASILARFAETGTGLEAEAQLADVFLAALERRGFSLQEAAEALAQLRGLVFGAAVVICCDRARAAREGSVARALHGVLARHGPEQLSRLRQVEAIYAAPAEAPARALVEPLIAAIARRRGETL